MKPFRWMLSLLAVSSLLRRTQSRHLQHLRSDQTLGTEEKSTILDSPSSTRLLSSSFNVSTTDPLRQFVGQVVLKIPDLIEEQSTWIGTLYLNLTNFICFNLSYEAIHLNLLESEDVTKDDFFQLEVVDLLFQCTMNVSWSYGKSNGMGTAAVESDKNYLTATMSTNLAANAEQQNEDSSSAKRQDMCQGTEIDLDTLVFDGDLSLQVLNLYRGFIRRIAESKVEEISCELIGDEILGLVLNITETTLDAFSNELPVWRSDPLHLEGDVILPNDGTIIDLVNDTSAGALMDMALKNLNSIYAVRNPDPAAITHDGLDYGINSILRAKLLKEQPYLTHSYNDVIVEETTPLVDLNVTMREIRIYGLDSATVLTPATVIGSSSIQTQLHWQNLTVEADLIVIASASTHPDSFFVNANDLPPIVETATSIGGVNNLDVTISLFVPLDRTEVEALPMGYILGWESLPACIPDFLSNLAVAGLDVTVGNIQEPVFRGIASTDIDMVSEKAAHIGLVSFEERILEVLPAIFQTKIRDIVDEMIQENQCTDSISRQEQQGHSGGRRRLAEEEFEPESGAGLYINIIGTILCVCTAALAAGLTMGLLSLDELMLLIKQRAGATEKERKAAASLLPIVRQHHLLLVSLLLMNAIANEALPLFLDKIVPGFAAVIISVTLVLFFGEIIPSALFTGPDQVSLASSLAPLVRTVMFILSPIAWPIAKVLDHVLHEEHDTGYNRGELTALVRIQYEEHLANKRHRKSLVNKALKEYDSMDGSIADSYASSRSSGKQVRPEIRSTIRAMKRQFSNRHLMHSEDLHVDEVAMVEGALRMGTTDAVDVYTPWDQVFAIPSSMKLSEANTVRIYRSGYSRIPVYVKDEKDPNDNTRIIGILSSRKLMVVDSRDKREVSTLPLTVPRCVSPHTSLVDLVNMFQTGGVIGSHMALVCTHPEEANEALKKRQPIPKDAGLMGVVTLEDVLESLIQEQIYDENDRQERKKLQLARWCFQRWRRYVKAKKKSRGDPTYASIKTEPQMLQVVEEAVQHQEVQAGPTESTSLLSTLNPFR